MRQKFLSVSRKLEILNEAEANGNVEKQWENIMCIPNKHAMGEKASKKLIENDEKTAGTISVP